MLKALMRSCHFLSSRGMTDDVVDDVIGNTISHHAMTNSVEIMHIKGIVELFAKLFQCRQW